MPPRQRPAPHAREGTAEAAPAKRRRLSCEGAQQGLRRELADLLRASSYQVSIEALAERVDKAPSTVSQCLN
eukprot:11916718-Ditylum_brightwellii.AAC.1